MNLRIVLIAVPVLGALLFPSPAIAQTGSRFYVGALAGPYYSDADRVTGFVNSVGITGGVQLSPWFGLEVDLLRPAGMLVKEYTGTSVSFAAPFPPGTSREEIDRTFVVTRFVNERRPAAVISVGATFRPRTAVRRLTPGLFVGISNHSVRERTVLEHLSLPPGVTLEQVNRTMPPEGDGRRRQLGAITFGGSLAIAVTPHLSIAPDVRFDYGSIGDEINNMLRTSVRAVWHF
jgi:hypothetical protein